MAVRTLRAFNPYKSRVVVCDRRRGIRDEGDPDCIYRKVSDLIEGHIESSWLEVRAEKVFDELCPLCRKPFEPDTEDETRCAWCGEVVDDDR